MCEPAPLSVTPVSTALPAERLTALPPFSDVVVDPSVSLKMTGPVGTVEVCPAVVSVTVAVIVTGCPMFAGEIFDVTATDVVSPGFRPVPLTETCCALPATLRVLFVTVIPALKLPTDCGTNVTETSQTVPLERDVEEVHGFASAELLGKLAV